MTTRARFLICCIAAAIGVSLPTWLPWTGVVL